MRVKRIVALMMLITFMSSNVWTYGLQNSIKTSAQDSFFGDMYEKELFIRTDLEGDVAIEKANIIMNDGIYLHDLWEPYYPVGEWDFDYNPYGDSSWMLYMQSLRPVSLLCNAYEESGNAEYLKKAIEISRRWFKYNEGNPTSEYAWDDHAASNRTINLLYLVSQIQLSRVEDREFFDELIVVFEQHGTFLADDKYYRPNNHGIMMDKALAELALVLENYPQSEEWFEISKRRMMNRLREDFDSEGVHKEHSPAYHVFVMDLFNDIENWLNGYGESFGDEYFSIMTKAENYIAYFTKPNLTIPMIGDSSPEPLLLRDEYLKNPYVKYAMSQGTEGIMPKEVSKVYSDAGVAIFRDKWNHEEYSDTTFFMLQAAYHSLTHKHADDLSFVLYSLGHDVLVDGGKYGFRMNEYRKYLKSVFAHNSIVVDGENYSLSSKDVGSVQILDYANEDCYDYVHGVHRLYDGVLVSREFLYLKPNVLIIFDRMISDYEHSYEQLFNLSPQMEIQSLSNEILRAKSVDSSLLLKISQLEEVEKSQVFNKDQSGDRGYASFGFYEITPINQVVFETAGTNAEFSTILELDSEKYTDPVKDIKVSKNGSKREISYTINGDLRKIEIELMEDVALKNSLPLPFNTSQWLSDYSQWEVFSNKEDYKIIRTKTDITPNSNDYLIRSKAGFVHDKYANKINGPNLSDVYSNSFLYLSVANEDTGWTTNQSISSQEIREYLDEFKYDILYNDTGRYNTSKLLSEYNQWEVFSNRDDYRIVRARTDVLPSSNDYLVVSDVGIIKDKYANKMDGFNLSDVYSNGFLYLSISNKDSEWPAKKAVTSEDIKSYLEKYRYSIFYNNIEK